MRHFKRIHIAPDAENERFVSIIDKGNSYFASAIDNLENLTLGLFLKAACFFRLPKGAFAIIDIYQVEYLNDAGEVQREHVFDYTVHNSRGTLSPLDKLPEFLECENSLLLDVVSAKVKSLFGKTGPGGVGPDPVPIPPKSCTTVCGDGIERTISCPDPISQHAECQGGPLFTVKCVNDRAPVDE